MNPNSYLVDFKIDNLKEPILKRVSGDLINTEIPPATKTDSTLFIYLLYYDCTKVVQS